MPRLWLMLWCLITAGAVCAEEIQYTFRPGDSLWAVCETFARDPNQCWQELAQHNGIASPRQIKPGTVLNIPSEWLKQQPVPVKVRAVVGEVLLYPQSGTAPQPLAVGMDVNTGDAVETGMNGSARVVFADQSELTIKPETLVLFDRYSRFQDSGMVDTSLRLERGELRTYVRPRQQGHGRFIINTPSAAAAVRGTRFDVEVDAEEVTRNIVLEGTVALSAEGQERLVEAGQASVATPGAPPSEPREILPAVTLSAVGSAGKIKAGWAAAPGADRYWLELYQLPDKALLSSEPVTTTDWQRAVPQGEYQLVVRAVDDQGIRGQEAIASVSLLPSPSQQLVDAEPVAEPAPHSEDAPDWRGLTLFLVGTAVILL